MKKPNMKAVCLLSGGLDSCALTANAVKKGHEVTALSLSYGQQHVKEVNCARKIAEKLGVEWRHAELGFVKHLFKSALLSGEIPDHKELGKDEAAVTYVPMRNALFLTIATGLAESIEADNIFIATNIVDYSGYVDCRPEFVMRMQQAMTLGGERWARSEHDLRIHHLGDASKADIIRLGWKSNAPFELSWSCYKGLERPCVAYGKVGQKSVVCDSCYNRIKGYRETGLDDPALTDEECKIADLIKID